MPKPYEIVSRLPLKDQTVQVISRDEYRPFLWEPIVGADTKEEADNLAAEINAMGGAMVYLEQVYREAREAAARKQ